MTSARALVATLVAGWVCATAHAAAPVWSDDFEQGNLSKWTATWMPAPQNTLETSTEAAWTGTRGLRLVDTTSEAGAGGQNQVSMDLGKNTGDYHVRFWWRLVESNNKGSIIFAAVRRLNSSVIAQLGFAYPSGTLSLAGGTASGGGGDFTSSPSTFRPELGRWYLVELSVIGVGGNNGQRRVLIDGQMIAQATLLSWSGADYVLEDFVAGEPWSSERTFLGVMDFDNFRAGPNVWPNRFDFAPPLGPLSQSGCSVLTLRLVTFSGAPRAIDRDLSVTLGVEGGSGEFFADDTCTQPVTTVPLTAGSSSRTVGFRPSTSGALTLLAQEPDFLAGRRAVEVLGPTARVSPESAELRAGEELGLDASGSEAVPGGAIVRHHWSQLEGPTGVPLEDAPTQALKLEVPGDYTFRVVVEDALGAHSAPALARVRVVGEQRDVTGPLQGCAAAAAGTPVWLGAAALMLWLRRRRRSG